MERRLINKLIGIDGALLLTFQALLLEENVTRAANALSLSQSTMSGRLAKLRELFDDPLFVPSTTGRGMVPTERANALRADLENAIRGLQRLMATSEPFSPEKSLERSILIIGVRVKLNLYNQPPTLFLRQPSFLPRFACICRCLVSNAICSSQ